MAGDELNSSHTSVEYVVKKAGNMLSGHTNMRQFLPRGLSEQATLNHDNWKEGRMSENGGDERQ